MTKTFQVHQQQTTDIHVGAGLLDQLDLLLNPLQYSGFVILCDSMTKMLFEERVRKKLSKLAPVYTIVILAGEKSKDMMTIIDILKDMQTYKVDRKSAIIALGGGVVGDIATFVGGIYLRGIDCIQIPTTLLAQVDSSIGGKGGVNIGQHKNTAGLVKQPRIIISDTSLMKGLPEKQVINGMGEVVKYAVALDKELFNKLEEIKTIDNDLEWIMARCMHKKMEIVQDDPFEIKETRMQLNFGHTFGHAVELLAGTPHGEAVTIGMHFAIKLSQKIGIIDEILVKRIMNLLHKYSLPTTVKGINMKDVTELMQNDKKTVKGNIRFILLKEIGQTVLKGNIDYKIINEVAKEVIL